MLYADPGDDFLGMGIIRQNRNRTYGDVLERNLGAFCSFSCSLSLSLNEHCYDQYGHADDDEYSSRKDKDD